MARSQLLSTFDIAPCQLLADRNLKLSIYMYSVSTSDLKILLDCCKWLALSATV